MTSQKPTALQSLAAGAVAGGVESIITVSAYSPDNCNTGTTLEYFLDSVVAY